MVELIKGSLIWLLAGVCTGPIFLLLFVYKAILVQYVSYFRPDLVSLNGIDSSVSTGRSHEEPGMKCGFVIVLDTPELAVDKLRDLWKQKFLGDDLLGLPGYENFVMCMDVFGGLPFRRRVTLESLEELIYSDTLRNCETFEEYLERQLRGKYKKDCPAWKAVVVPLKESGETALVFHMPHALADGYSFLHILDRLTGNQSPYIVKDPKDSFVHKVCKIIRSTVNIQSMIGHPRSDIQYPKKLFNSSKISFASLDLKDLKTIRSAYNVHMASLVTSLVAGTVQQIRSQSPFLIITSVGWPNHPTKIFKDHPKLGNHVATMNFEQSMNPDPLTRLLETEEAYKASLDQNLVHLQFDVIFPLVGLLPVCLSKKFSGSLRVDAAHSAFGIGGDDYNLLGCKVNHVYTLGELTDCIPFSLLISTFSHSNILEVTITTSEPELSKRITDCRIKQEIERLKSTLI